jgi:hypothetical protein
MIPAIELCKGGCSLNQNLLDANRNRRQGAAFRASNQGCGRGFLAPGDRRGSREDICRIRIGNTAEKHTDLIKMLR